MTGGLRFELELASSEVVRQEPVGLHFSLTNLGETVEIPTELSAGDITTIELYDAEERLLVAADDYTRNRRQGLEAIPIDPATMLHAPLQRDETAHWQEDLLSYLDLTEPGDYTVRGRFRAERSALELWTEPVSLRVLPLRSAAFDAVLDEVAMAVLHVAQVHREEGRSRIVVHFRSALAPDTTLEAVSLTAAPPTTPLISVADFATRETYEHDFRRWLAWREAQNLCLASVREGQAGPVQCYAVGAEVVWLGRPVQHGDDSVSVLLVTVGDGEPRRLQQFVRQADSGAGQLRRLAASRVALDGPRIDAYDQQGTVFLLFCTQGSALPLGLLRLDADGTIETFPYLHKVPESRVGDVVVRVLGVGLDVRVRPNRPAPLLSAAVLIRRGDELLLWAGVAELTPETELNWRGQHFPLVPYLLAEDEQWQRAEVLNRDDHLAVVLATSAGRLLLLDDASVHLLAKLERECAEQWRVLTMNRGPALFTLDPSLGPRHQWL